jgi:hypothetical protein
MAKDIDDAFVRQFESEVHEAYQRRGAKLLNGVRRQTGITGRSTTFQRLGIGAAGPKDRHGLVPTMQVDHTPIECTLLDRYAGDWADKLDLLKTNIDERQVLANAGAFALGRETDTQIIAALNQGTNNAALAATAINLDALANWITTLGGRDVPIQLGEVFGVVSWPVWRRLLGIQQFTSGDFVGDDLPFKMNTMEARAWGDVIWMPHSGLGGTDTARPCHIWHMRSIGHATGAGIETDVTWHGDRAAWFINNMMSMNAVMIDAVGIERRTINETT